MNNEQKRGANEPQNMQTGDQDLNQSTSVRNAQQPARNTNFSAGQSNRISQRSGIGASRGIRSGGSSSWIPGLWASLIGVGAGIGAAYLLDRDRGGRRRALISDKFNRTSNRLPRA